MLWPSTLDDKLQIMELFGPTIQGEGIMTGTVTHFLRTGGCALRCSWCDSLFAVLPDQIKKYRTMMTVGEIYDYLAALPPAPYVTFTGGDPCIQERLGDLIPRLNLNLNMQVAVETQGMYFPDWLQTVDVVTFSPKGPSSGNIVDISDLKDWLSKYSVPNRRPFKVCIKIVCFGTADYKYALDVYTSISPMYYDAFYFTAGTPLVDTDEDEDVDEDNVQRAAFKRVEEVLTIQAHLADQMLKNEAHVTFNEKVHLGCQQHVLLWPDQIKGV